ncbi:cob(I)yrinic acid a c-diamide adenosyltransferase [bacterium 1xD8-48]|jgi:cob(I)alamin adenosyltransferase|nr:cob(I)yrinic acid a c-diamide adenosyltransferase [Lachnospiraceae bacterium]MCI9326010.1 cob(I)yrinic acid a c-diamide adenosyltransferase [Lachnospiraceae bacterium]NBJ95986.1 cob(I)yrinic acid a c-diamide adenosyltransferase [bacterium 1xD8-48]
MGRGCVYIYCGDGHGKSPAALGRALLTAVQGKNVVIIRFLRGRGLSEDYLKRLEPEIKMFRFEKSDKFYDRLSDEEKAEEIFNIKNGINFAKKVLTTGECDLLILDEILELIDNQIITVGELKNLLDARDDETDIILTGVSFNDEICMLADEVSKFETLKMKEEAGGGE